jgi:hypothetical protein
MNNKPNKEDFKKHNRPNIEETKMHKIIYKNRFKLNKITQNIGEKDMTTSLVAVAVAVAADV